MEQTGSKSFSPKLLRTLGLLIFGLGILVGMVLFGSAAWADFEASLFDTSLPADGSLSTLRCPLIITASEVGQVTASFNNPTSYNISPLLHTGISGGSVILIREDKSMVKLAPGETKQLSWTVTAEDAVWDRFVLVRVLQYPYSPLKSRSSACGIILLHIQGMTGGPIAITAILASLLFSGLGLYLWRAGCGPLNGRRLDATRAMAVLAAINALGILAALLAWTIPAILLFFAALLLIVVAVANFIEMI
jgi:hypothetical protein